MCTAHKSSWRRYMFRFEKCTCKDLFIPVTYTFGKIQTQKSTPLKSPKSRKDYEGKHSELHKESVSRYINKILNVILFVGFLCARRRI